MDASFRVPGSGPRTNGRGGCSSGCLTRPLSSLLYAVRYYYVFGAHSWECLSASVSCLSKTKKQKKTIIKTLHFPSMCLRVEKKQ